MPRQSIEDLGPPPASYRVDNELDPLTGFKTFEHEQGCRVEDERRIHDLQKGRQSGRLSRHERWPTDKLVEHVQRELKGKRQRLSAASRLAMREWRIRVGGWLWSLVDELDSTKWVFFTVVVPSWWTASDQLLERRADRLKNAFRAALYRAGAAKVSGWLYAMVHGEYDGGTDGYPLHLHGIATEGMVDVLRALRKQPQFQHDEIDQRRYPQIGIRRKLVIQQPWGGHAALCTYTSKSYWPRHDSRVEADGVRRRFGKKRRIDDPVRVARHLLWLHANRVKDQVLLVHLSVVKGELVPSKRENREEPEGR